MYIIHDTFKFLKEQNTEINFFIITLLYTYKVESVIKVKIVYCIRNLSIFICTTYFGEEYKCSDSRRFTKKGDTGETRSNSDNNFKIFLCTRLVYTDID